MNDLLQAEDQYYVLATNILADHETRVLKQGETFAVFDPYGDIEARTHSEAGIFFRGTRHLSRFELRVFDQERPLLLNSTLRDDNGLLKVDMTTKDVNLNGQTKKGFLQKGTLYIQRENFLFDSCCQERIQVSNYGPIDVEMEVSYIFAADFADIFEVRGTKRKQRGKLHTPRRDGNRIVLTYDGLDEIRRLTSISFSGVDFDFDTDTVKFKVLVPSEGSTSFSVTAAFSLQDVRTNCLNYQEGLTLIESDHREGREKFCGLQSSNEQFDQWARRSTDDLIMLTTKTDKGHLYPYAGIPWFCAPFGRDGIITALQCLWTSPSIAKGTLEYLAATQATEHVAEQDSTPGKIIHEVRMGEMTNLKEVPFGSYYGSIDSTPLFICLGGQYLTRTADVETIERLWPSFEKALFWLDRYGDLDGDGFLEYQRENPNGLVQQGWKDSHDSVFHNDRSDAVGPIALCEVQGYTYMAKIEGARMAETFGNRDLADSLRKSASMLRDKFDEAFWVDDLGTYALALDGKKRQCRIRSSNAGHCLFTGIVKPERAAKLVDTLMSAQSFCGWGVKTIADGEARHNPMSYHNGSVWPHDTSLIAWGMSKYGFQDQVETLFDGLFKAASYMELFRLPEVYCGFPRKNGEAPTLHPHACAPQAWASGALYMMVQALLGLDINSIERRICFTLPRLPSSINTMKISGMKIADKEIDFEVQRHFEDVGIQLYRREKDISVIVQK